MKGILYAVCAGAIGGAIGNTLLEVMLVAVAVYTALVLLDSK